MSECDKVLEAYIHDYLVKNNFKASAQMFQTEGKVSSDLAAIDEPGGFLLEWWSSMWDTHIARTNARHSDVAASYVQTQLAEGQEQQQWQQLRQINPGSANAMAAKIYEEKLKGKVQSDSLSDPTVTQMFAENVQLMDLNNASMLKSYAASGHSSGQVFHGSVGAISHQVQIWDQQLPVSTSDLNMQMNSVFSLGAAGSEGKVFHGSVGAMSPQVQIWNQQLPVSTSDLNTQMNSDFSLGAAGSEGSLFGIPAKAAVSDIVSDGGSLLQAGSSVLSRDDHLDMWLKYQQHQKIQLQKNNLQEFQQHNTLSHQPSQFLDPNLMSNFIRGSKQPSINLRGRKRKQPVSSSGPANSTGTANTIGPSPSPIPSTPSLHIPNDVICSLPHTGGSPKPLTTLDSDGAGILASRSNLLWDDKDLSQPDMNRFVEDGSLHDNIQSLLSSDDPDPRDHVGRYMDVKEGLPLTEVNSVLASGNKLVCCHFSSDGKLLASGGYDKKVVLWHVDSLKQKRVLKEHLGIITDVRFSSGMPCFATSSIDKTVKVWDAENPGYSLRTFTEHSASVVSLDFHPIKEDLICSCDWDFEMRYWSINNGRCARVFKGGSAQGPVHMRFQPRFGRYLAAGAENVVFIFDVETQARQYLLQGHTKAIHSICWHHTGDYLASVSEDSVRVWSFSAGSEGTCVHDLSCNGDKFASVVFHPSCSSLLVIGCYQSLVLWNMDENMIMTVANSEGLIADLAASAANGLVASASHNKVLKLWK